MGEEELRDWVPETRAYGEEVSKMGEYPLPLHLFLRLEAGIKLMGEVVACWTCGMSKDRCPHCPHQTVCVHLERLYEEEAK